MKWKHTKTRLFENKFCAAIIDKHAVFCICGQKVILDNDYDELRFNEHSRNLRCKMNNQKCQLGLPDLFPILPKLKKVKESLEISENPSPSPSFIYLSISPFSLPLLSFTRELFRDGLISNL
ncbi:unnamed protein product [Rhizophagus irregularis]|uniref:Uncharacterized protein n=1 Tax=Rhizophagus irregularis TaxID=588596 RepID=A0A2I1GGF1_9GLOM|nr:hypothetical protein RhiirA4_460349 [Rhizophagus irregularis]CAB4442583.1 unnamed protein product [Rhizophagus irregularis]